MVPPTSLTRKPCTWKNIFSIRVLLCWGPCWGPLDSSIPARCTQLAQSPKWEWCNQRLFRVHSSYRPPPPYLTSIKSWIRSAGVTNKGYFGRLFQGDLCNPGSKEGKKKSLKSGRGGPWEETNREIKVHLAEEKGHSFCDSFMHFQKLRPTVRPVPWSLLRGWKHQC